MTEQRPPSLIPALLVRIAIILAIVVTAIVLGRALAGCTSPPPPPWESVAIGDTAKMPENGLITAMNPDGVKYKVHEYAFGDQCLALAGDPLTAVAFDGDRVLVRHGKPVEWFYGVCVPGVLTFVWKWEFFHMNDRYAEAQAQAAAERELVRRLLQESGRAEEAAPENGP